MKKLVTMLACALFATTMWAQQALFGGTEIVSPEVNADGTVTFRLYAPKAVKVEVTGDFLPQVKVKTPMGEAEQPGVAELKEGKDGVWTYTTEPLAPELYYYTFKVDGMTYLDPSNVYMSRDIATYTNIFIVEKEKGDTGDLYSVNDVPHGNVSKVWYDSPTLKMKRRMTVYTPAGYDKGGRYPVLYLLHGAGGDEDAWTTLGRAAQIMDNLIARGEAEPMIVVMPNGNVDQEAAPGESDLGLVKPNMRLPHTMEGSMEQSFPDIVKFIESNYRVQKKKAGRAIAGLSMGGFHSLHISKQYPDLFDYVGLFSAAIWPDKEASSPIYQDMEGKLKTQFGKHPKLYWIAIGKTDFLYKDNVKYRQTLDEHAYPYEYYESDGGHIWKNWRIYLSKFAPMLFK